MLNDQGDSNKKKTLHNASIFSGFISLYYPQLPHFLSNVKLHTYSQMHLAITCLSEHFVLP